MPFGTGLAGAAPGCTRRSSKADALPRGNVRARGQSCGASAWTRPPATGTSRRRGAQSGGFVPSGRDRSYSTGRASCRRTFEPGMISPETLATPRMIPATGRRTFTSPAGAGSEKVPRGRRALPRVKSSSVSTGSCAGGGPRKSSAVPASLQTTTGVAHHERAPGAGSGRTGSLCIPGIGSPSGRPGSLFHIGLGVFELAFPIPGLGSQQTVVSRPRGPSRGRRRPLHHTKVRRR